MEEEEGQQEAAIVGGADLVIQMANSDVFILCIHWTTDESNTQRRIH